MEDIQDGIKKSIQDGVEEDPELGERLTPTSKTALAIAYIMTTVTNPTIETVIESSTDSEDLVATISTIIETEVA